MTELDEARLIEKLRAIEALHARPGSAGERAAVEHARDRILERLRELAEADPPMEYQFSMVDMWSRRVFIALLRRYGIRPYRYRRQRRTTVMARVSRRFVDETLWPQFEAISDTLRSYLDEVTDQVISEVLHADVSEATVMEEPKQLSFDTAASPPGSSAAPPPPPPKAAEQAAPVAATPSPKSEASSNGEARRRRNRDKRKRKKRKRR